MSNLDRAREQYRLALLRVAACAGETAREIEQGKSAKNPYDASIKDAYDEMWRAHHELSRVYRVIHSFRETRHLVE